MDPFEPLIKRPKYAENEEDNLEFQNHGHVALKTPPMIEESPVDHESLAIKYPELQQHLIGYRDGEKRTIDFTNDEATRFYNRALLNEWFGIKIDLPSNHLCPTVLSRAKYIRWIATLLKHCGDQEIVGIDVGTGASCIYPLLGRSIYGWDFIATDIDPESLQSAAKNVELNGWQESISVVRALPSNPDPNVPSSWHILLGTLDVEPSRKISEKSKSFSTATFSMCNPPFFENPDQKVKRVDTVCVATDGELATIGGEVEFVKQMIRESVALKTRISWFTSLLGKKSSLYPILEYLQTVEPLVIESTTFTQGRNSRWAVAWTFNPLVKSSLISERSKSLRYTEKRFLFDTDATLVTELSDSIAKLAIGAKIRKISDVALNAIIYESSPWVISNFGSSSPEINGNPNATIGPGSRPETICSIKITLVQLPHRSSLTVICDFVPGTLQIARLAGIEYQPEHIFGVFARELKHLVALS
jgi:methyltransferase